MNDSFATPWTVALQDPLSMGFPRQEYWSGLPFLSPGDLLEPGIAPPTSPTLAGRFFTAEPPGQPVIYKYLYIIVFIFDSVQFSWVSQSRPTLCNPMDCSTPGLPVHHQLLELTHTHVHWVSDAIQPSHPLSSPSPLAFNLSQHQGLFQ